MKLLVVLAAISIANAGKLSEVDAFRRLKDLPECDSTVCGTTMLSCGVSKADCLRGCMTESLAIDDTCSAEVNTLMDNDAQCNSQDNACDFSDKKAGKIFAQIYLKAKNLKKLSDKIQAESPGGKLAQSLAAFDSCKDTCTNNYVNCLEGLECRPSKAAFATCAEHVIENIKPACECVARAGQQDASRYCK